MEDHLCPRLVQPQAACLLCFSRQSQEPVKQATTTKSHHNRVRFSVTTAKAPKPSHRSPAPAPTPAAAAIPRTRARVDHTVQPARPRQVLNQHHHRRHLSRGSPSPPPTRQLPALRPTYEALLEPRHPPQPLGQADQFEAITPDAEMILAGFYGLPYCVPVPDVLEQRSRAIAEAEEAEYRERKSWRQRARLSGRVEAALKGLALPGSSRSRSRNGRKV
jgi:hypothetical protein